MHSSCGTLRQVSNGLHERLGRRSMVDSGGDAAVALLNTRADRLELNHGVPSQWLGLVVAMTYFGCDLS